MNIFPPLKRASIFPQVLRRSGNLRAPRFVLLIITVKDTAEFLRSEGTSEICDKYLGAMRTLLLSRYEFLPIHFLKFLLNS